MQRIRIGPNVIRCVACETFKLQKFHHIGYCESVWDGKTMQVKRVNPETGRVDPHSLRYCLKNVMDNRAIAPFSDSELREMDKIVKEINKPGDFRVFH